MLAGHSAGCVHVASYLVGQGGGALDGVRGAGLLSGFYTIPDGDARSEIETLYYSDLHSADVSTLDGLLDAQVPLLFAVAQSDPPFSHAQVAALTAAWFARHRSVPHLVWSEGHNHISQIGSIGVDDLALGAPLARFVSRVTSPRLRSSRCSPLTDASYREHAR